MKEVNAYPPNYQDIISFLGEVKEFNPIFCWGDIIYNPFGRKLTKDVIIHEQTHSRQQSSFTSPELWYVKYLQDPEYRLQCEIEAYGIQYYFAKQNGVSGKLLEWLKDRLANELSGKAYGNLLSFGEAVSKIRNYGKSI